MYKKPGLFESHMQLKQSSPSFPPPPHWRSTEALQLKEIQQLIQKLVLVLILLLLQSQAST